MRILHGILIPLFICLGTITHAAGFHTFKDTQGREMEAKITRVSGEDVYIERRDGLNTKVKRSIFSQEDQTYITEWAHNALLESGIFEVRFSQKTDSRRESESGGIERDDRKVHYNIIINNKAYEDFSDLRVEYLILKFEDALSAQKRSEGTIKRIKGSANLNQIRARKEAQVSTKDFSMLNTKLAPGYVWSSGGKKTSKDVLKGIWVKIYVGDTLAYETSKPENMMRKERWDQ